MNWNNLSSEVFTSTNGYFLHLYPKYVPDKNAILIHMDQFIYDLNIKNFNLFSQDEFQLELAPKFQSKKLKCLFKQSTNAEFNAVNLIWITLRNEDNPQEIDFNPKAFAVVYDETNSKCKFELNLSNNISKCISTLLKELKISYLDIDYRNFHININSRTRDFCIHHIGHDTNGICLNIYNSFDKEWRKYLLVGKAMAKTFSALAWYDLDMEKMKNMDVLEFNEEDDLVVSILGSIATKTLIFLQMLSAKGDTITLECFLYDGISKAVNQVNSEKLFGKFKEFRCLDSIINAAAESSSFSELGRSFFCYDMFR
jgi:hypothetical protein